MAKGKRVKEGKTKRNWRKIAKITFIVLVIIILGIVGGAYGFLRSKLGKMNYVDISDVDINEGIDAKLKDYRNIALLGIDTDDSYSGARSDNIIIVSINEKTKDIKLVSVYRDSYMEITGRSLDKVTHAYAYGGPALTMSTLNTNLDLNIKEFVAVNFDATKEIIDAVGGVKLKIESDEVKHIDGINSPGSYTLNGNQALQYARIRKEAGRRL